MEPKHPSPEQTASLKALWQEAFGDTDAFIDSFFRIGYSPRRCMCIAEGTSAAAAAYWLDGSLEGRKVAYIYAVATAKAYRNRGLCRRLLNAIHETLAAQGYRCSVLVPDGSALAGMYAGMGYRFFGGMTELSVTAGAQAVPLSPVSPEEYMLLRRQYLPKGGIVQEGRSLDFLASYASFCAGADFLLAYQTENNTFRGIELLGNAAAAPGILAALGWERGTFRIPGSEPFAMWHPLTEDSPAPAYLGHAFD